MTDLYLTIAEQSDDVLQAIAASMNDRISDPNMRAICANYMGALPGDGAEILEIGCGNGASTEMFLDVAQPRRLLGIDPAEGLLGLARTRFAGRAEVAFESGEAVRTGQPGESFDLVLAHTVYSHLADPAAALAEAFRVLKPGGTLAIFDGDYATNTVALFDGDPLQTAMQAAQRHLIHDLYIMRRVPRLLAKSGFDGVETRAHGFVQTGKPDYLLSLMARGVDAAVKAGEFGPGIATALCEEAGARVANGGFYGAILFVSAIARKPE